MRDDLVAPAPAAPTITRRGLLGFVGAGSALLLLANVGETVGGPLRRLSLLAPRSGDPGPGPNGFQVNKTARVAGITPAMTGDGYRLVVRAGERELRLSRADLLAMEQRTEELPIACVEGWTTTQRWTGVPLAEPGRGGRRRRAGELLVESLQRARLAFRQATLTATQFGNERSLLALKVNGADLSLDHGFPARVIVPALPGVHNTKWVGALTFAMSRFARRYGASPLHALAHLAAFALAGFALLQLVDVRAAGNLLALVRRGRGPPRPRPPPGLLRASTGSRSARWAAASTTCASRPGSRGCCCSSSSRSSSAAAPPSSSRSAGRPRRTTSPAGC